MEDPKAGGQSKISMPVQINEELPTTPLSIGYLLKTLFGILTLTLKH